MFKSNIGEKKVQDLINDVSDEEEKVSKEALQTKYSKPDMIKAVKQLTTQSINDKKELLNLQNKIDEIGEPKMDDKDIKILKQDISELFDDKLDKKFAGLEDDLKTIKESNAKVCTSGDCFADKLDDLDKKIVAMGNTKEDVNDLKSSFGNDITGITDSITTMDERFNTSISGMEAKLKETCTGIDCIKERFEEEDDTVKCPACENMFSLSANTVGSTIVCPECKTILE